MLLKIWQRIVSARGTPARPLRDEISRQHAEIVLQRDELARQSAEIDRLREENRALLNSILGVAGIPPIQPARDTFAAVEFAHVTQVLRPDGLTDCKTSLASKEASYIKNDTNAEKFPAQGHSESSTRPVEEEGPPARGLPAEEAGSIEAEGSIETRFRTPPPTPAAENEFSGTPAQPPIGASEAGTLPRDCPVRSDADARPRNDPHLSFVDDPPSASMVAATREFARRGNSGSIANGTAHDERKQFVVATETPPRTRPVAPPLRRRSWHQITQALELESARNL